MKLSFLGWTPGSLAKNTLSLTLGHGLRVLVQAVYFILIARSLGATGYGAFASAVALVAALAPFSGWGAGTLLVKNVARRPEQFSLYWGHALIFTGITGAMLVVLAFGIANWLLSAILPWKAVLAVAIADLLFAPMLIAGAQAFQTFQRAMGTALVHVLLSTFRLVAVFAMIWLVSEPSPVAWSVLYLVSTVLASIVVVLWVTYALGRPHFQMLRKSRAELSEGFQFSLGLSAQRTGNEIDKTLLAKLSTLEATGIYSAAFRLIDVVFMPVNALIAASYARFFQRGARGPMATFALGQRLLPAAFAYAAVASIGIFLLAPLIPTILGKDFAPAVEAARSLAILPVMGTLYLLAATALTTSGRQNVRNIIDIGTATINILLNLWLIPRYSYYGAVWAMLISKGFAVIAVWHQGLAQTRHRHDPSPKSRTSTKGL